MPPGLEPAGIDDGKRSFPALTVQLLAIAAGCVRSDVLLVFMGTTPAFDGG